MANSFWSLALAPHQYCNVRYPTGFKPVITLGRSQLQIRFLGTYRGPIPIDLFCSLIFMPSVTEIQFNKLRAFSPLDCVLIILFQQENDSPPKYDFYTEITVTARDVLTLLCLMAKASSQDGSCHSSHQAHVKAAILYVSQNSGLEERN